VLRVVVPIAQNAAVSYSNHFNETLIEMEKDKFIRCIGVDGKLHVCEPHKDTCKCGVKVAIKKSEQNNQQRYSCYECTY